MDETSVMRDVLQRVFVTAERVHAKHVRVINLAVCDEQVDAGKLTRVFETLTFTTIAQGAQLHVRRDDKPCPLASVDVRSAGKLPGTVRLDSVEMD